jgi:hypothetical protein
LNSYQSEQLTSLQQQGLNLQAVFDIQSLPTEFIESLSAQCADLNNYHQLILLGHGGRTMWDGLQQSDIDSDHPVDDYSIQCVEQFFADEHPQQQYKILYPGTHRVGLQQLGKLAGWHHPSPFWVGVNNEWGSWYAYRVVVLANSNFTTTSRVESESPCDSCDDKPCISICPANALTESNFDVKQCSAYRLQENSNCSHQCLSRLRCPVGKEHRYSREQIEYHYGVSYKTIKRMFGS